MSQNDLSAFLEDLLLRYDPGIDLSEGSRAKLEIIDPIVARVGIDPIDDNLHTFILERLKQSTDLAISEVDETSDLIVDPMRVLLEPIVREIKLVRLRASLNNYESLSDDELDSLLGNFFEAREQGDYARGQVRIYFATPQSVSLTFLQYASTRGGLRFLVSMPQACTVEQMLLNVEGSEYYFDVNYTAENRGDQYNVEIGEIVNIANLPGYTRAKNLRKFQTGLPRETGGEFVSRVQSSQGDKTLNTDPGIVSVLEKAFPGIRSITTVGFRDPEMRRDVITGGGYTSFLPDDVYGHLYGADGAALDDGDGDFTTPLLSSASGNFVYRFGSVGTADALWYITLIYVDGPAVIFKEVRVLEVVDSSTIRVDWEMPLGTTAVRWILRKNLLTISDIPGGIVLPNGPNGTLQVSPGTVHVGGKVDVYIGGAVDQSSAEIQALGDESPFASGISATTNATDQVALTDIDPALVNLVEAGMSLVLDEGVDAGSYQIRRVITTSPFVIEVSATMTGSQTGLVWRIVDVIDVTLTDPVTPKTQGADLVVAAGSPTVVSALGANFLDAGVQKGDTLEILGGALAARYDILSVAPTSVNISPTPQLSQSAVAYKIYKRSQPVDAPIVRIKSIDLLDSSGAPTGVSVPYKHPVLALSRAFQNETSQLLFDDLLLLGLVSDVIPGTVSGSITLDFRDIDAVWGAPATTYTDTFAGASLATIAASLSAALSAELSATVSGNRLFIAARRHVTITGSLTTALGMTPGYTNATVRAQSARTDFMISDVREGDVIEFLTGAQAGTKTRIAGTVDYGAVRAAHLALGPTPAHKATLLNPSVNVRAHAGRPSIGSARVFFLNPTTAEFPYATSLFTTSAGLSYRPDPTNLRSLYPAPPTTTLPNTGSTAGTAVMTDANGDFIGLGVAPGDLLEVLYIPIVGNVALAAPPTTIAVGGLSLLLRVGAGSPWVQVSFPFNMVRQDVVDYINTRMGAQIADLDGSNHLRLQSDLGIDVDPASTAFSVTLGTIVQYSSDHPDLGTYVITTVAPGGDKTKLTCYGATFTASTGLRYKVLRYTQRTSTTEMTLNADASGLYYADVELISTAPGNEYNIQSELELEPTGYFSEGYELIPENEILTYSRAEVLKARLTRSILLDGSSDALTERVQLSQQNVLISYERSQLVEDVQGFCDSDSNRVVVAEALVRHLFPNYVNLRWKFIGGPSEIEAQRVLSSFLEGLSANTQLEIGNLEKELRTRGTSSIYVEDTSSPTGRTAPFIVVVYHGEDRRIRASIVRDFLEVGTRRFLADTISVSRVSTGGIQ